jgi:2-beta-glucuronyltransferase
LADLRPTWRFTIIGRWSEPVARPNLVWKGETPFKEVVPYVQHADIGLAAYLEQPGVEYQTHHSNRLQQYTFLKLPVLVPSAMQHASMPHLVPYRPDDRDSMEAALRLAANVDRTAITLQVPGWSRLAQGIAQAAR